MPKLPRLFFIAIGFLAIVGLSWQNPARAASPDEIVDAVISIYAEVPNVARTARTLGSQRRGTGLVIDSNGLILTVGYIILEAAAVDVFDSQGERHPADIIAYDHESGLGLIRTHDPLDVTPIRLGSIDDIEIGDPLLVLNRETELGGAQVKLVDRREFAGYWEYLLDNALFTSPRQPSFAGAALIDQNLRLVGVGSLSVGNAAGNNISSPGNMFIPSDELIPIMADLLSNGRRDDVGRPWLGLIARDLDGNVFVQSVADDSPAGSAGLRPGDRIVRVSDQSVAGLADFYRKLWALGDPGVTVPLDVRRKGRSLELDVVSADRYDWLRFDHSY